MKTLTISVTAADIEGASTNMCTRCPIARAMSRTLGMRGDKSRFELEAQPNTLLAVTPTRFIECETPPAVKARLNTWDATGKMEPFTFEVPVQERGELQPTRHWIRQLFFQLAGASMAPKAAV